MADRLGPGAVEDVRGEHFELLRGSLEQAGGREVKNLGDGLMVVFASAAQALTCRRHQTRDHRVSRGAGRNRRLSGPGTLRSAAPTMRLGIGRAAVSSDL